MECNEYEPFCVCSTITLTQIPHMHLPIGFFKPRERHKGAKQFLKKNLLLLLFL
jgi:hypothetical protein